MRPRASKLVLEHLAGVTLALLAVTPWLLVTTPSDGRVMVLGAVVLAAGTALVARYLVRLPLTTEVAASATLLLVFLLVIVIGDPRGFAEVARGLRDGVPRILSTTLPILDVRWPVVPAAMMAWVAGGAITSAIGRSRSVAGPVSVALVAFVSGYAVTLGGASGDPTLASLRPSIAVALLACCLAALRADIPASRGSRRRSVVRVLVAAAIALVSVSAAALVVDAVPYLAEDPVEPRVTPVAAVREPPGPTLVTRRLRGDEPDRVAATVTVDQTWSGYVAIAVLDDYDGRVWHTARDRFDPTGGVLPVELPVPGGAVAELRDVDVDATGGWLPFVGRVASVEGASVLHNGGGALQLAEASRTVEYRLRLAQPSRDLRDEQLPDDAVVARGATTEISVPVSTSDRRPAGERVCRFLALSRDAAAEPNIGEVACGTRAPADVGFLRALSAELRAGRALQEDLVGGDQLESGSNALYDLLDLVGTPPGQAAVGTPEQFASAFALMAHDFGLPVRVVTGFRVEDAVVGEPLALTGAQTWTWVEVPVEDVGWVVVDPSPSEEDAIEVEELEELEGTEDQPEAAEEERTLVGVDPAQAIGAPPPPDDEPSPLWLLAVSVPLLPLIVIAVTVARRWFRRRRRRHDGAPRHRIVGAWHEVLDAVYDAGIVEVEPLSARELTDGVVEVAPWLADAMDELATEANRAIFSSRPVGDADVARAWHIARRVRRDLRRSVGWRRRAWTLLIAPPARITRSPFPRPIPAATRAAEREGAVSEAS